MQWITVTTFTKSATSCSEIIVQWRSRALSTCLEMLYATSFLRTSIDGVASLYRGTFWCFSTTFVFFKKKKALGNIDFEDL